MMSLTFGLFSQVSGSGPLDPLVHDSTCYLYVNVAHLYIILSVYYMQIQLI